MPKSDVVIPCKSSFSHCNLSVPNSARVNKVTLKSKGRSAIIERTKEKTLDQLLVGRNARILPRVGTSKSPGPNWR